MNGREIAAFADDKQLSSDYVMRASDLRHPRVVGSTVGVGHLGESLVGFVPRFGKTWRNDEKFYVLDSL